jgi:hypothetical protein
MAVVVEPNGLYVGSDAISRHTGCKTEEGSYSRRGVEERRTSQKEP